MIEDLIARLKMATGPDRALDGDISMACGWRLKTMDRCRLWRQGGGTWMSETETWPPAWTASMDAARGLSNWIMTHASNIGADGLPLVVLGDPSTTPAREVQGISLGGHGPGALARAYCIAALRARLLDHAKPAPPADEAEAIPVPVKLLREAHACMRECGWQLAPAADDGSDGVLQAAVADVEDRFRTLLEGMAA